jgi:hypothetical protein
VRLQELRCDNGWEEFYIRLVEFCVGHCIPNMQEPYILRGGICILNPNTHVDVVISRGYRIVPYNHVITLNLNIFKIVLLFSPVEHWSSSVSVY